MNTENTEINEGTINFDIVFYVRMKDGLSQIIVNVEAQKDMPTEYHILNRAIFYACRLVSSQKERDFVNKKYDDIKQVYTIWICMNMPEDSTDYYYLANKKVLGNCRWEGKQDLLNIVLLGLARELPGQDKKHELHRLLGALLSKKLSQNEKLNIIEKEYDIPLEEDLRKDVSVMCNPSQGIVDDTKAEIILNMFKKGCLRVNHVSFKIGDTKEFILEDININFEKNKKYAIVGSSGSGKTTLLRLILGLYKDIQGNILANTENLKNISLTEWREHYISSQK